MTILHIFLVILLIYIINDTKLVRFIRLICRIVDFSSLFILEVIAKNVKIKKFVKMQIRKKKIKIKQKEIDQDIVIKMFENLKPKVHMANENGLTSLLKF